jgi:hypothetical protein
MRCFLFAIAAVLTASIQIDNMAVPARTAGMKAYGTPAPATPAPTPKPTPEPDRRNVAQTDPYAARLVATFRPMVGIHEQPMGSNRGPEVDRFNRAAKTALGSPWCASVAHYGYELNGLRGHGAYSPDWFAKSRVVPRDQVRPGDMALVWFPAKGRYAHTITAVESVRRNPAGRVQEVVTLEGNTNAQGSREGDQFARRIRAADGLTFVRWRDPI